MILSKNRWKVEYEYQYEDNEAIDILYRLKGIDDYINYFNLGFKDFDDPYLFKNMDIVVKKIKLSIRNKEKILIYGDYDVDGITATAILYRILKEKGADIHFKLPNRFQNGYGLSMDVVSEIIEEEFDLVITVDNGITSVDEIKELTSRGITVILTDHHEPKEDLPQTPYIIHSYIMHDYPFENMCGAGVAFKIAEAIDKDYIRKYIDLAMLGTIADMMPLIGENKAIINEGLKRINNTEVKGLKRLLEKLNIRVKSIKDISYNIAPKLNALGRIGDASISVELLTTDDDSIIDKDINAILDADRLRKELTIQNTELAFKLINDDDQVNIIYSNEFYEGVLGIIAQKIVKKTSKITGVFNVDSTGMAKGSFRSYGDYNILEMLESSADLIDKYGGHEKACGLTLMASNLKPLKDRLSSMVKEDYVSIPSLEIPLILNHTLLTNDFFDKLETYDLEDTIFLIKDLEIVSYSLLVDKHTKIKCRTNNNRYINVIVFNETSLFYNISLGDKIDIVGNINTNFYNGNYYLQIIAQDYKIDSIQVIDYRRRNDFETAKSYFNNETGLIIKDSFDNLNELSLLIKEQSPNIIYLGPSSDSNKIKDVTNMKKLKEAIYIISTNVSVSEFILMKQLKLSRDSLNTILEIFEELNLITRASGMVKPLPREKGLKVELLDSETYKFYKEQEETVALLTGPVENIKKYVLQALE